MTTLPGSDFIKQLIALLSSSGGIITLPLDELSQLGVEITLSSLASPAASLTLRLGAKIYYVPASPTLAPTQEQPPWLTTSQTTSTLAPSEELAAVNSLNNQPPQPTPPPRPPVRKTDLDLWMSEQRRSAQLKTREARLDKEARAATRQYPWETRPPTPKQ